MTPLQLTVCALLMELGQDWMPLREDLADTHAKAVERLVAAGLAEAKLPVQLIVHGPTRRFDTLWRVTGAYVRPLRQSIDGFLQAHDLNIKKYLTRPLPIKAVRITDQGEWAKERVEEQLREPAPRPPYLDVLQWVTGGHDGSNGHVGIGRAVQIDGDPFAPTLGPAISTEGPAASASPASPPAPAPAPAERAPGEPRAGLDGGGAAEGDRLLRPGEQAELLLGPRSSDGRDQPRRLQITGAVRAKAIAAGFLRHEDVSGTGRRSTGVLVRAGAWALPVAYFRAILAAARTAEGANKLFPGRPAAAGREFFFCGRCVATFSADADARVCPRCRGDVEPLALRRPA